MGSQESAKAVETGHNDAGITHMIDCRGDNVRGSHIPINEIDVHSSNIAYVRVPVTHLHHVTLKGGDMTLTNLKKVTTIDTW